MIHTLALIPVHYALCKQWQAHRSSRVVATDTTAQKHAGSNS